MPEALVTPHVTAVPAAEPRRALEHFESLLTFETDCWDVHAALAAGEAGFVLLDVRSPELFAAGHIANAVSLPYRRLTDRAAIPRRRYLSSTAAGPIATVRTKRPSDSRGSAGSSRR